MTLGAVGRTNNLLYDPMVLLIHRSEICPAKTKRVLRSGTRQHLGLGRPQAILTLLCLRFWQDRSVAISYQETGPGLDVEDTGAK
jgi:hypothetical protein